MSCVILTVPTIGIQEDNVRRLVTAAVMALLLVGGAQAQPTVEAFTPEQFSPEQVPPDQRERVLQILRGFKLIAPNEDLSVLPTGRLQPNRSILFANPFCQIGCDSAAALAAGACSGLSAGAAVTACLAAAEAGRQYCRSRC